MLGGNRLSKTINVAIIGMDEKSKSRMKIIFRANFKNQCRLSSIADADIAFIDTHKKPRAELEKIRLEVLRNLKLPLILLGENISNRSNVVCISNPPKLNILWEHILRLTNSQYDKLQIVPQNAAAENRLKIDKTTNTLKKTGSNINKPFSQASINESKLNHKMASMYFKPDDFLLGQLQSAIYKARQRACSIQVICWDNRRIIVYPGSGVIFSDLKPAQLKNLGLIQVLNSTKIELCNLDKNALYELSTYSPDNIWTDSIDTVLWNLALRTSRGKLPEGTSLSKRYVLTRWPNLTRFSLFPNCFRIAAYWTQHPASLQDIAHNLSVEKKYVFLFYSAACAIDLIKPLENQKPVTIETSLNNNKNSLFSALLNSLSSKLRKSKDTL